jgi:hypothetical protein
VQQSREAGSRLDCRVAYAAPAMTVMAGFFRPFYFAHRMQLSDVGTVAELVAVRTRIPSRLTPGQYSSLFFC